MTRRKGVSPPLPPASTVFLFVLAIWASAAPRTIGSRAVTHPDPSTSEKPWLTFTGTEGQGKGHAIVLIAGDQEFRSEETLPQLARILAQRHGFTCTVLFAIDPADGTINPTINNIPGLEHLQAAELMVLFTRFL